jgi:hypothetical protein
MTSSDVGLKKYFLMCYDVEYIQIYFTNRMGTTIVEKKARPVGTGI